MTNLPKFFHNVFANLRLVGRHVNVPGELCEIFIFHLHTSEGVLVARQFYSNISFTLSQFFFLMYKRKSLQGN